MIPVRHIGTNAPRTDEELLAEFQQTGEQQVLATLYLRYTDLVYGTCVKYLKQAESAKDAVMNIYQELLVKLPHHQVSNFKSWLYVVTKNHCLMQLRKEQKHKTVSLPEQGFFMQSEDLSHLDSILEKEADFKRLGLCMEQLAEAQKQAVTLFYLENKCYQEITEITGSDWNKVRSLIQNGRRNLKNCMESNG
ncbi:RNA polymerase sigma factor [Deminuibacter soli]|uniref:RNA polymerase sigma factor n=1 Tax=Deminuibacter soli TaxID=2291815 RepID=A0A3E1NL82_9BACT|nr:RNA polymerase sigma factor [Deminuibacter soli]RFM28604.1 RNA polymerase sigma factor [Deminuibacter soli]